MIVDQLFNPKPLKEGGPYDLPGIDYDRPGDIPRRPRPQGGTTPRRHPDDPDFMDPDQRRLRADQARVKKAQDEYHAKKGVAEGTGQFHVYHKVKGDRMGGPDYELLKSFPDKNSAVVFAKSYNEKHGYKCGGFHGAVIRTTTPAQGVAEGSGDVGNTIRQLYQQFYDQGDDALEYLNTHAPLFAQFWDQYEGDLDSIIAEVSPKNLIRIAQELKQIAGEQGVAEGSAQDSKSWMASIEQQHPGVRFVQAKMPGAPIIALVNGKPVAQFDTKQDVEEDLNRRGFLRGLGMAAAGAAGLGAAGAAQARATPEYLAKVERAKALMAKGQSREQTARIMGIKGPNPGGTGPMSGDWGAVNYAAQEMRVRESTNTKQRKLNEARLMEDPVYRNFKRVGRYISEQKLTEPEILQIFSDAETGMTDKATGANRTFVGRGKDATVDFAKDVAGAVNGVLKSIQDSVTVQAVDTAWDQATDAMANMTGGQKGAIMTAINKYRNLAKQYPKTAGFAKAALVAVAGLATGGAGLPAIAGLTYALDSAIKGDKLSSVLGKGTGAAALAAAGQGVFGGATQPGTGGPADTSAFTNVNQMGDYTGEYVNMPDPSDSVAGLVDPTPDLATYTVQADDNLSKIADRFNTSVAELKGLNPQLAAASGATGGQGMNVDVIFPGQQITLPPGTPGTDVYAGGVGTSADTMADIAKGNVPNSPISQAMAAKGQAAADTATSAAPIDYTQAGPVSTDSLGQKLEYGIPVNADGSFIPPNPSLPADELAKQTAAYDAWKSDFMKRWPNATQGADGVMQGIKPGLAPMYPTNYTPGMNTGGLTPKAVQESVKIKKLSVDKLIDQKATVLSWALNESVGRRSHSVNLTTVGTYAVFENVERYRRALLEYAGQQPGRPELPDQYRPDMSGGAGVKSEPGMIGRGLNWLDKGVKKVGGALSNFGHQFTTNVTKEKLKMNWHQAGKPSDSDQLAAWLVGQGVPQEVVTSVFGKMGIPYTAPATAQPAGQSDAQAAAPTTGTAQRLMPFNNINPKTGQRWTVDDLEAERNPQIAAATDTTTSNTAPAPTATKTTAGGPAGFNAGNIFKMPGMEKYAKPAATPPAKTPNFAGPAGYGKVTQSFKTPTAPVAPTAPAGTKVTAGGPTADEKAKLDQRIAQALKQPVAEMLQMVETKEDVQRIKQFVDQTFVKYGAVNESAFAVRNQILEHVTQVGAQRRREHSQRVAH